MGGNATLRKRSAISPIRPFDLKKPGDSNGASRFLRLDNLSGQVFPFHKLQTPIATETPRYGDEKIKQEVPLPISILCFLCVSASPWQIGLEIGSTAKALAK